MHKTGLAFGMVVILGMAPLLQALAPKAPQVYFEKHWGDRTVAWSSADFSITARHQPAPLFSLHEMLLAQFTPDQSCERESDLDVLSVVGPFVSVHRRETGNCVGSAHPYAEQAYQAFDLRKNTLGSRLDEIFPPSEILHALLGDRLVQHALKRQMADNDAPMPKTLPALVSTLSGYSSDDCTYGFSDDLLTRYAFHHLEGNKVAVRLGLSHGCEVARGRLTQIGLLLPIPAAWRSAFEAAAHRKDGFLTVGAPKGSTALSHADPKYPK